jgi:hypothetical protein
MGTNEKLKSGKQKVEITMKSKHSHPIVNRLKAIDFIGGFEWHGSKKRLIPSHSTKKRQKRPIFGSFVEFLWDRGRSRCGA